MESQLPPLIGDDEYDSEQDESECDGGPLQSPLPPQGGLQPIAGSVSTGPGLQRITVVQPRGEEKRGWFSGPTTEEKERRLRCQIKAYVKQNPGLKIDKLSKLDQSLVHMDLDALKDVMLNLKSQMGGPGPYESSKSIINAGATFVEKRFKVNGYGKRCRENAELVSAFDSICPIDLGDYAAPIQIIVHLGKTLWDCIEEQNEQAANPPPQQNYGSGPVPSRQNNVRSTNDQTTAIPPSEEDDCCLSDLAPGDVRPDKRLRTA
jgi:hypothetical protein